MIHVLGWQELLLFVAGLAAGYINVLAGGGSLLTIPAMLFLDIPAPIANGTNRIAILAQSLTSIWVFVRKGLSEIKLSITLALSALPGAWFGAHYGVQLQGVWFNRLLAFVMLLVMCSMIFEKRLIGGEGGTKQTPQRVWLTHALMLLVGFYGGLLQIGVGFLIMAILHRVMGLDLIRVNIHKVFLVLPFTLLSLFVFASELELRWITGVVVALGMGVGGWLGAHLMLRKGEQLIRLFFYLTIVAMIIKLLFFSQGY